MYLKKEVTNSDRMTSDHKKAWAKYGCSVMCDGWKDKCGRVKYLKKEVTNNDRMMSDHKEAGVRVKYLKKHR